MISRSQVCALDPEKVAGSSPATVIAVSFLSVSTIDYSFNHHTQMHFFTFIPLSK
ncbi:hypothetical protein CGRA01v4_07520 [Colletotrichum graminicola]|nr:hypothetical protein CGRA01v4_07520 [Colletotrichum graminicola]